MAEVAHYTVTFKELVELIVKKLDLHEGIWELRSGWALGPANMGPTPDQVFPGVAVAMTQIGIHRVAKETSLAVDAAKINPRPEGNTEGGS